MDQSLAVVALRGSVRRFSPAGSFWVVLSRLEKRGWEINDMDPTRKNGLKSQNLPMQSESEIDFLIVRQPPAAVALAPVRSDNWRSRFRPSP